MRLRVCSIVALLFIGAGVSDLNGVAERADASIIQSQTPQILSARVKGKKLILTGVNFDAGAVVLVNGEPQKTRPDLENPTTILVAKKAAKSIPDDTAVNIQVQNPNSLSEKFPFFKGRVITFADAGKPISLQVGDRFLLFLLKEAYEFAPEIQDTNIIRKVTDVEIPGSQGVFEAISRGNTKLFAIGTLPCHREKVACLAPALRVDFDVIVE